MPIEPVHLTKEMFNVILTQMIDRELIEHKGDHLTTGTTVIRQNLELWQQTSHFDISDFIVKYMQQVIQLSYIIAELNYNNKPFTRDDVDTVPIVDEDLINKHNIYQLAIIELRDFK